MKERREKDIKREKNYVSEREDDKDEKTKNGM